MKISPIINYGHNNQTMSNKKGLFSVLGSDIDATLQKQCFY